MSQETLLTAVSRLEAVAARLETLATSQGGSKSGGGDDGGATAPFVLSFDDLINGHLAKFLSLSNDIGGDVKTQCNLVSQAFQAQRGFLVVASKSKPPAQNVLADLLKPLSEKLQTIMDFKDKNRGSAFFNHLSAISESIGALGWVTVSPAPGPYVKEMSDAGVFYSNRVLKDFKDKDQKHVDWTKAWTQTMLELQAYIKQYHTTGVSWNLQGGDASAVVPPAPASVPKGGAPPPPGPPPPPPPPPPQDSGSDAAEIPADNHAALFADINKGADITKGLRKVSDDMKTHKNPALRQGPAPFKAAGPVKPAPKVAAKPAAPVDKPPVTELQNKKWVVEYHKGNRNIVLGDTNLKQTVYVYKCVDSTIQVKGKVNTIILDSCKKTAVCFDDVLSSVEFVNCQSVQGQVVGKVPTISIDKTDGCMMYLSKDSLTTEIVSAKSSEMNILIPGPDGEYKEYPIPEQFKTVWNGKGLTTTATESV